MYTYTYIYIYIYDMFMCLAVYLSIYIYIYIYISVYLSIYISTHAIRYTYDRKMADNLKQIHDVIPKPRETTPNPMNVPFQVVQPGEVVIYILVEYSEDCVRRRTPPWTSMGRGIGYIHTLTSLSLSLSISLSHIRWGEVCVYIYIYMHMYIHIHTLTSLSLSLYIYIYISSDGERYWRGGYSPLELNSNHFIIYIYIYIYTYIHIHIHIYVYIYIYTCIVMTVEFVVGLTAVFLISQMGGPHLAPFYHRLPDGVRTNVLFAEEVPQYTIIMTYLCHTYAILN